MPPGFWRAPNGSIRVLIRVKGWPTAVKTFKLVSDTPEDRRRQLADAQAWAADTRRRMYAGAYASTREAETMTLGDALRRYAREGLSSKPQNRRKDEVRIEEMLGDEIANRSIASLTRPDLAAYRDLLIERSYSRRVERAAKALSGTPGSTRRIARLRSLVRLRAEMKQADPSRAKELAHRIAEVEQSEGVRQPARTTIWNNIQIVTRALKLVSQTVVGVPDISGVAMPASNPGRTRRPTFAEIETITARGAEVHPLLPLIVRFATATALRMERVLECRTRHIQMIADGKYAICFPKSVARSKRTGIVPLTAEIEEIVLEACRRQDGPSTLPAAIAADIHLFPISANALSHAWRRLNSLLGIEDLRLHDLRHEATSRLFEKGLNAAEVMSVTGHSTNDMVDRYAHYSSALVLDRLQTVDQTARTRIDGLAENIALLVREYRAVGGDERALSKLIRATRD